MTAPTGGAGRARLVPNARDFWGGLVLVGIAAAAFWGARDLPGGQAASFGPGTAPRLFAGLLGAAGALVAVLGLVSRERAPLGYTARAPLLILASVLVFAATIRPAGLLLATFVAVLVASAASSETRWREAVPWAVVLSVACALLFSLALKLPIPLLPAG